MDGRRRSSSSLAHVAMGVEMLTFFGMLPPPDFRDTDASFSLSDSIVAFGRREGRQLDLTHLLPLRRLMLIGHLTGGPTPLPLQVDGDDLPSRGWTTVRWICRLPAP